MHVAFLQHNMTICNKSCSKTLDYRPLLIKFFITFSPFLHLFTVFLEISIFNYLPYHFYNKELLVRHFFAVIGIYIFFGYILHIRYKYKAFPCFIPQAPIIKTTTHLNASSYLSKMSNGEKRPQENIKT